MSNGTGYRPTRPFAATRRTGRRSSIVNCTRRRRVRHAVDARASRGRSDRGAVLQYGTHRTGGRRSAHRRRRPGIRDACRPMPAGCTRGRAVAGPQAFVPPVARREMTRDGYRLLVRLPKLLRNTRRAHVDRPAVMRRRACHRGMNTGYSGCPCHRKRLPIRSCRVMIGKKTLHCTLYVYC